jgi:hypothetical protein
VASYLGSANFAASSFTLPIGVQVTPAATNVILSDSTSIFTTGDTFTYGQPEVLYAQVINASGTGPMPTGAVQFFDDAVSPPKLLGQAAVVNGFATLPANPAANLLLTAGAHDIIATYLGTANFGTSRSNSVTPTVLQASTSTSVVSVTEAATGDPVQSIYYGDPVVLSATVSNTSGTSASPTGMVQFFNFNVSPPQLIGQASLVGGVATLPANPAAGGLLLGVGGYIIAASYVGNVNFVASGSAGAADLLVYAPPTSISLSTTTSGNQVTFAGVVTDTAPYPPGVMPPPMSGVVQVYDGSKLIATVAVARNGGWTAALRLGGGTHSITVNYVPAKNSLGYQNFQLSSNSTSVTI